MNKQQLIEYVEIEAKYEKMQDELYTIIDNIIVKLNSTGRNLLYYGVYNGINSTTFFFETNKVVVNFTGYYHSETDDYTIELPLNLIEDNSKDNLDEFLRNYLLEKERQREEERKIKKQRDEANILEAQKEQYRKLYEKFNGLNPESL